VVHARRVFQPHGAGIALLVLVAVHVDTEVRVIHEAAGGPCGDQRQIERLAWFDDAGVGRDASHQGLECVVIRLLQQVGACQLDALAAEQHA